MPRRWEKYGECPTCGAPIFVHHEEITQNDVNDPPTAHHTCTCRFGNSIPNNQGWWQYQPISVPTIFPVPPGGGSSTITAAPVTTTPIGNTWGNTGQYVPNGAQDARELLQETSK